jgi:hypothetical protein
VKLAWDLNELRSDRRPVKAHEELEGKE